MKNFLQSRRSLFILGFLLLLAINALVLISVTTNRKAPAEAQVILTERELQLPTRSHSENSGISLRLNWRVFVDDERAGLYSTWASPKWFGADKLKQLGFSLPETFVNDDFRKGNRRFKKEVIIVLESDSSDFLKSVNVRKAAVKKAQQKLDLDPENQQLRKRLKRLLQQLHQEQVSASRLFAIDAGLDAKRLRQQYPDRHRYLLVKGVVAYRYDSSAAGKKSQPRGTISRLDSGSIHVPLDARKVLERLIAGHQRGENPRYQVELAYGQRLEPWIVRVYSADK